MTPIRYDEVGDQRPLPPRPDRRLGPGFADSPLHRTTRRQPIEELVFRAPFYRHETRD